MILDPAIWRARAAAHAARVDEWVQPHLERRRRGIRHPVHDFLFTYYSHRPSALRRWHPGYGVTCAVVPHDSVDFGAGYEQKGEGLSVAPGLLASRRSLVERIRRLLLATASRPPALGCLGLHEWAMVYAGPDRADHRRHDWPLRLGQAGTDEVVAGHRVGCSHFDAFRFFTPAARGLNTLQPGRDDREAFEQPGCLHAGMDLYKHSFRLSPLVPSELVADCFELACDIRELDMRASPYDLADLGYSPVPIETAAGKREYVEAQRAFAERGAPLRQRLVTECDRLLAAAG
ncbi:MAG: 3-methyladenine DNA glycosylase [Marmoricola sp.]